MDFQFVILLLTALVCPIGMGAMMWWMHRGMSHTPTSPQLKLPSQRTSGMTEDLAARNQALETRVAELEQRLGVQQKVEH